METVNAGSAIAAGLALTDLDARQLWLRYFALGGNYTYTRLCAYVDGQEQASSAYEHDMAAHALNEYLADRGMDHLVSYTKDL